jgi:hypothetical protein
VIDSKITSVVALFIVITNSIEQSPSSEAVTQLVKKFPASYVT